MFKNAKLVCLISLLLLLICNFASAAKIANKQFISEAKIANLKPRKTEFVNLMGNTIKSIEVKHSNGKVLGITRYEITCSNILKRSSLNIAVGVSFIEEKHKDSTEPVPCLLVINNAGKRVDIPIKKFLFDSGRSTLFGAWSEYQFKVPLNRLKMANVTKIDAMSVVFKNPDTDVKVKFEPVLKKNETKRVNKLNDIYNFFLKLTEKYEKPNYKG